MVSSPSNGRLLYESIGTAYSSGRRTDPTIARRIWAELGNATSVVNIGAGTGSYEPPHLSVVAVEPSSVMRSQRSAGTAPCVAAMAESLPFANGAFDVAMEVLSIQHWSDPMAGLREMTRVANRAVCFQWDKQAYSDFWLIRDYLPEMLRSGSAKPGVLERAASIGARIVPVPIPWDCQDGFFHSYWRRPEAYLDELVRRTSSPWSLLGEATEERAVAQLHRDLESGAWHKRNADLMALDEMDLGARLLITEAL